MHTRTLYVRPDMKIMAIGNYVLLAAQSEGGQIDEGDAKRYNRLIEDEEDSNPWDRVSGA